MSKSAVVFEFEMLFPPIAILGTLSIVLGFWVVGDGRFLDAFYPGYG